MPTAHAQQDIGSVVTLQDGSLAIQVYRLDDGRLLVLTDGHLCAVSPSDIRQRPATCSGCGGKLFWWDDADYRPRCLVCVPPDGAWRAEVWELAAAFIERNGAEFFRLYLDWLVSRDIPAGGWQVLQQLAFGGRVGSLVCQWHEEQGLW